MSLDITPNDFLLFKGPYNKVSVTQIELFNNGSDRIAFKVFTTAPKRYCAKPNVGFLEAQERYTVQIKLQPITNRDVEDNVGKHKFMIRSTVVSKDYTDEAESFWKQSLKEVGKVRDVKLTCKLADEKSNDIVNTKNVQQRQELKATVELGYLDSARTVGEKSSDELMCSICHNVLWKPIACRTCENVFCTQCIRTWITKSETHQNDQFVTVADEDASKQSEIEGACVNTKTCPFHCAFEEKRAPPIINNLLSKLQIYCAYRTNGCQQKLNYNSLEAHEQTCEFASVPCSVCKMLVSHRDSVNKQHDIRTCFEHIKTNQNNNPIQTQIMMLLNIIDEQNKRIKILEDRLNIVQD